MLQRADKGVTMSSHDGIQNLDFWLLEVRFPNLAGYTLWYSGAGSNDDLLLAIDKNIVLFKKQKNLRKFLRNDLPNNLALFDGYDSLKVFAAISDADWVVYPHKYYFSWSYKVLFNGNWENWSLKTCSKVLDDLNLIYDCAKTVEDAWIIEQMTEENPLSVLMNELTVITLEERKILEDFDYKELSKQYLECLDRVELHTLYSHNLFDSTVRKAK